jgi:multidrug efflux system outer membrane protein
MMKKSVLAVLITAALTGCTMTPTYERPSVQEINGWTPDDQQEQAVAPLGWREVFGDPALQRLIELSLESNQDLKVALLNVERYKAQYQIQRAELVPSIDISGTGTRQRSNSNGQSSVSESYSASVGIASYELDLFGRVRSLNDQALQTYLAQTQTQRATQLSIVSGVASAYLNWVADREQLSLAEETLKIEEDNNRLVNLRYEQGVASSIEQAQALASYKDMQVTVSQYRRLVEQDFHALTQLVGQPLPEDFQPASELLSVNIETIRAGLPSELLNQRPDLLAAEYSLRAANANIGAAKAAMFPRISLTASAGSASSELNNLFDSGTRTWSFIPSISIPIFHAGALKRAVDVAEIDQEIAVAQYQKAVQTAFTEVADALTSINGYREELGRQSEAMAAYQKYFDLADLRYQNGLDNMLTRLDAQSSLVASRQAEVSARLSYMQSKVNLYEALGGGWYETVETGMGQLDKGYYPEGKAVDAKSENNNGQTSDASLVTGRLLKAEPIPITF